MKNADGKMTFQNSEAKGSRHYLLGGFGMKEYARLLRMKHYIKNFLIFIPMFFGGSLFNQEKLFRAALGFVCFSLLSSAVYILNDYKDREKDRNHPTKRNRPLASGSISEGTAIAMMIICLILVVLISVFLKTGKGAACLLLYYALNVAYSMELKNRPIIDIVILASGFVIRVFYGGYITDVQVSKWLYLVVATGSLYMGLGKRRNEFNGRTNTRAVLKYYNEAFLDKNMYVCVAVANVFYALWTLDLPNSQIIWTVPLFMIILMRYSLDTERESDGDPVEVILRDKVLIALVAAYALYIFALLYFV